MLVAINYLRIAVSDAECWPSGILKESSGLIDRVEGVLQLDITRSGGRDGSPSLDNSRVIQRTHSQCNQSG